MSINKAFISGNLTRDPELRRTQSGMAILSFGVAVNDRRKNNQTGEWEDYPNFIDCTMFGGYAEKLADILFKGMKVSIEGKLRWSQWERDGQKRSKIEVVVDEIVFFANGQQQGYQQPQGYQPPQQQQYQPQSQQQFNYAPPAVSQTIYDEDIPF